MFWLAQYAFTRLKQISDSPHKTKNKRDANSRIFHGAKPGTEDRKLDPGVATRHWPLVRCVGQTKRSIDKNMRSPGFEPGSVDWKSTILTARLQAQNKQIPFVGSSF